METQADINNMLAQRVIQLANHLTVTNEYLAKTLTEIAKLQLRISELEGDKVYYPKPGLN